MNIDMKWLEEHVFLCKLDGEDQKMVEGLFEVVPYSNGDLIVSEGEPGGELFLLRSGRADISCHSNGNNVRVAEANEGSLFGEMGFLTGDLASATVIAVEDCVVYKLSRGSYSELMMKKQDLVYALFAYMLVHTSGVIRRMNEEHVTLQNSISGLEDCMELVG